MLFFCLKIFIKKAFELAKHKHQEEKRASDEDHIVHPVATAHILILYQLVAVIIAVILLHDVLEDTD